MSKSPDCRPSDARARVAIPGLSGRTASRCGARGETSWSDRGGVEHGFAWVRSIGALSTLPGARQGSGQLSYRDAKKAACEFAKQPNAFINDAVFGNLAPRSKSSIFFLAAEMIFQVGEH